MCRDGRVVVLGSSKSTDDIIYAAQESFCGLECALLLTGLAERVAGLK